MEAIWPDAVVEENNLSKNISTLRRIFGESPISQGFIITVPGHGYRFVAEVTRPSLATALGNRAALALALEVAPANDESLAAIPQPSPAAPKGKLPRVFIAVSTLLLIGLAVFFFLRLRPANPVARPTSPVVVSEKSIAVLPFANLSAESENGFFTEGMQDDILTALAKVADLKVISRNSVASYLAGRPRNLREIGRELGVGKVLEGSVRRAGDKVRITAQLIDTRTNLHVWAETYDRNLADVFAIQSEIAQKIATALKAKLAPEEKARLSVGPTTNSEAYVLYLTALGREDEDEIAAEQLYLKAAVLDPRFALAYARASLLNSSIATYRENGERKAKAHAQAEEALRLSPTLAEAHMALGLCLYWGEKKYDAALGEFEIAAATSPNNARICSYVGGIYRRQGRWPKAIASFERALYLDPRNAGILTGAGNNYLFVRNWPAAAACYTRALELEQGAVFPRLGLAYLEVYRNRDPAAGGKLLADSPAALARWDLAMLARNYLTAEKILSGIPEGDVFAEQKCPKAFFQGVTARARGDFQSAKRYFAEATPTLEEWAQENPDDPERRAFLGLVYAHLQRKEEAIREGRRAVELLPENRDAFHGPLWTANLALVYALVGEQEQAITLIEHLLSIPGLGSTPPCPSTMTLADLRLRWEWDSLRNNPRFQKILASPEPETILTAGE